MGRVVRAPSRLGGDGGRGFGEPVHSRAGGRGVAEPRARRWAVAAAVAVLVLAASQTYIWFVVRPEESRAAVASWQAGQASRAELRRLALERWLSQGRHDAEMVAAFPTVRKAAADEPAKPLPDEVRGHLREILALLLRQEALKGVALLDRQGGIIASAGQPPVCAGATCEAEVTATLASRGSRARLQGDSVLFLAPIVPPAGVALGVILVTEPSRAWLEPFLEQGRRGPEERVVLVQRQDGLTPPGAHDAWYRTPSGGRTLTAVRAVNQGQWSLALQVDEEVVLGPPRRHAWRLSIQALVALGLLGLTAVALTYAAERSHEARQARQRAVVATLFEQANDALLVTAPDGRLLEANLRAEQLYGYSREELLRLTFAELQPEGERGEGHRQLAEALDRGQALLEAQHRAHDGRLLPVEVSARRVRWQEDQAVIASVRDISERRRAEARIHRLNRLLETLLEARAAVLRAGDRTALFDGVCRALTANQMAPLAWVGCPDDAARAIRPVAGAGPAKDYLRDLAVPLEPPALGGPVARAAREGRPAVCQDVVVDPDSGPWRVIQIEHGFRAVAAFPIMVGGRVEALLTVCLCEPNAFDRDDVALFQSLAADLGEALVSFDRQDDRRQAAEALKASEARYRLLAENAADVIWTLDLNSLRFTYVSPSVRRLRGLAPEEIVGRPLGAVLAPADAERVSQDLDAVLAALEAGDESQRVQSREVELPRREGTTVWAEVVTTLLSDASGRPTTVLGVTRDVSARHRAEAALRERTALLEAVLDSPAQAVFALDRGLRYTGFNQVHARATREAYGTQVALGQGLLEAITEPGDRARAEQFCRRALAGEAVLDEAAWGDARLGQRLFEVSYNPIREDGGQVAGVAVFALDVTERRRVEARVRQLWQAVEQSPVVVVITDTQGVIEYVNPRFSEVTGYSAAEAVGAHTRLLKSGQTPPEVYQELWVTLAAGGVWRGEFLNRRKDGQLFWEEASISPVRDRSGRITSYLAVKEDVTARKRAAQALEETQQLLTQAQKMEALGRLAGGVAHDFNNLLGVIRGHAELLHRQLGSGHAGLHRLDQMVAACDRAAGLSRQLLAFGRKQTLRVRVLDLGRVVREGEQMLRRLIGEDIDLSVRVPGGLAPVKADPLQIEQVLLNLAVNARDAMPEGGALTIELAGVEAERAVAEGLPSTDHVMLCVADNGCGMDAETLSHAFEPFFTTKEVGKGTGLGLATVYGIVTQLGGQVRVESQPGAGAIFRVFLPAEPGVPEPHSSPAAAPGPAPGRAETVLLVEDEADLREMLHEQLESLGYGVLAADGPEAALARSRRHQGPIDLLLTDVIMPGGNGWDLAQALRAHRPGLRVLLMSGYSADVLSRFGADHGLRLLHKPFTLGAFSAALREILSP